MRTRFPKPMKRKLDPTKSLKAVIEPVLHRFSGIDFYDLVAVYIRGRFKGVQPAELLLELNNSLGVGTVFHVSICNAQTAEIIVPRYLRDKVICSLRFTFPVDHSVIPNLPKDPRASPPLRESFRRSYRLRILRSLHGYILPVVADFYILSICQFLSAQEFTLIADQLPDSRFGNDAAALRYYNETRRYYGWDTKHPKFSPVVQDFHPGFAEKLNDKYKLSPTSPILHPSEAPCIQPTPDQDVAMDEDSAPQASSSAQPMASKEASPVAPSQDQDGEPVTPTRVPQVIPTANKTANGQNRVHQRKRS
jgi:hypothetical protein